MSTKPSGGGKNGSPFFEIKDSILIAKLFDIATRHFIPVTLWLKNQTLKFEAELTVEVREYKTSVAILPESVSPESFNELLAVQQSNEILGSLIIDSTTFFFKTTTKPIGADREYVRFLIPASVFKLQRRTNLRIPFQRNLAPKVTVFDPTRTWDPTKAVSNKELILLRMLDLSAGGCAVAARIEEKDKFAAGTLLHDLRFLLRTMEIVTEAVVRHVVETVNDKGQPMLRVGLQFKDLRIDFAKHISLFVEDESRKIFTLLQ